MIKTFLFQIYLYPTRWLEEWHPKTNHQLNINLWLCVLLAWRVWLSSVLGYFTMAWHFCWSYGRKTIENWNTPASAGWDYKRILYEQNEPYEKTDTFKQTLLTKYYSFSMKFSRHPQPDVFMLWVGLCLFSQQYWVTACFSLVINLL